MVSAKMVGALVRSLEQAEQLEGAFSDSMLRENHMAKLGGDAPTTLETPKERQMFGRCGRYQEDPSVVEHPDEAGHAPSLAQRRIGNIVISPSLPEPADFALAVSKGFAQVQGIGISTTPGWGCYSSQPGQEKDEQQPTAKGFEKGGAAKVTDRVMSFAVIRTTPGEEIA